MSAGETKLLNNIIYHALIKFYTYFACCFNYRQLFGLCFQTSTDSLPLSPYTLKLPLCPKAYTLLDSRINAHRVP